MSSAQLSASRTPSSARRIHAGVALALLEALRTQDLPPEILDDENVSVTLPRRLGLSDVIEAQIRRYRDEARRGRRIPEQEAQDLLRLVIRRPDSEEVFLAVGRALHRPPSRGPLRRALPASLAVRLARRRVEGRMRALFGGGLVRKAGKGFAFEAADDFLIRTDPGGDACQLVTGLAEATLEAYAGDGPEVTHATCLGSGGARCRWEERKESA